MFSFGWVDSAAMSRKIVQSNRPVTLLGGGALPEGALERALARAPVLVAADGAAETALRAGHMPQAVIGDMDSLSAAARAKIPQERLHHLGEQDSTDFDKALRSIAAPLVLAVGFTGARLDHELAVYSTLARRGETPCIVIGSHDICLHAAGPIALDLVPGARVSLFPLAPLRVTASGLRWPLENLELAPLGRIGTSNEAVRSQVTIAPTGPGLLVILPADHLDAAISAVAPGPRV
ncbi:thiamine diphosphokinase [Meinhardsimonia xiamenensis]